MKNMKLLTRSKRKCLLLFIFAFSFYFLLKYIINVNRKSSQDQSVNINLEFDQLDDKAIKTQVKVKRSKEFREKFNKLKNNIKKTNEKQKGKFLINTPGCKINDLPLYDKETKLLYSNITELKCDRKSGIKINRFEETWIQLNWTEVGYKPFCYYRQLSRGSDDYHVKYGKYKLDNEFNKMK